MYPGTRGLAYDVAVAALAGSWRHIILWIKMEYSDIIRSNYNHTPCILNSCVFSIGTVKVIKIFDQAMLVNIAFRGSEYYCRRDF